MRSRTFVDAIVAQAFFDVLHKFSSILIYKHTQQFVIDYTVSAVHHWNLNEGFIAPHLRDYIKWTLIDHSVQTPGFEIVHLSLIKRQIHLEEANDINQSSLL